MKATKEQLDLLNADNKIVIGCACPGSGKTWTLIEKAKQFTHGKVLITTYTRKCREEIFERLDHDDRYVVTTLHGLAYRIVREHWERLGHLLGSTDWPEAPIVLDPEEEQDNIEMVHGRDGKDLKQAVKSLRKLNLPISQIVHLHDTGVYVGGFKRQIFDQLIEYESNRLACGLLVMHDLLTLARKLMGAPDVAHAVYSGYSGVLIDEAQDLDENQWALLEPFLLTQARIFLIGDLNQSIFGYSGGNGMVFKSISHHPEAEVLSLTRNFRSGKAIVDAAKTVIDEWMVAVRVADGQVSSWSCQDVADEAKAIQAQAPAEKTTVLTRTRQHAEEIRPYLPGYEVMTVHQSKGKEFDICVVAGCQSRVFPSAFASNLEEEKNLFYVACSRARNRLIFTYQGNPSRFLLDLMKKGKVEQFDTTRDL